MRVELLNVNEARDFFKIWGTFACECYNTNPKFADKVGRSCYEDGHYSGSRTFYFQFRISDIDRGTAEQMLRHEIGVRAYDTTSLDPTMMVKNMKSFRYVDVAKDGLKYTIPPMFAKNKDLQDIFTDCMNDIEAYHKQLFNKVAELYPDLKGEAVIENINAVLPRATHTSLVIGLTVEALIEMMHKRLCTRTQDVHRKVALAIKKEVLEYVPELAEKLVPQCIYLTWCPEKKCCGLRPRKTDLKQVAPVQPSMTLNSDLDHVAQLIEELKENDGYCPCMIEKNEDTKCPCKPKREQNVCICELYV